MIVRRLRSWLTRRRPGRPAPGVRSEPRALDIELHARGVADALWAGSRPSVFRGSGVEADGVRAYVVGDDTRAVDWKVTARTGRLHVRELVEDRSTDVVIVLDRSASLHGGPSPLPGRAALLASTILVSAAGSSGHRVGLVEVAEGVGTVVPPWQTGRVEDIRSVVSTPGASGGSCDLVAGLERVRMLLAARSLVVLVSDFRVPGRARARTASAMARVARRHDVLAVRVLVPGPEDLPAVGQVRVRDPVNDVERVIDTSDRRWREHVRDLAASREAWWRDLVDGLRLQAVELDFLGSVEEQLRVGLEHRRRGAA